MEQLMFDFGGETDRIRAKFEAFHHANPRVYSELVEMARGLRARGIRHYGIAALYEVLRYNSTLRTGDEGSPYKLSNDYRAFYAREIMRRCPDLEGFFTTKRSVADE